MRNRRELFKFFGIAAAVPIVAKLPIEQAIAAPAPVAPEVWPVMGAPSSAYITRQVVMLDKGLPWSQMTHEARMESLKRFVRDIRNPE